MQQKNIVFQNSQDEGVNTAYIYLQEPSKIKSNRQIKISKYGVEDPGDFKGELVLDLDDEGRILGIEILGDVLPRES